MVLIFKLSRPKLVTLAIVLLLLSSLVTNPLPAVAAQHGIPAGRHKIPPRRGNARTPARHSRVRVKTARPALTYRQLLDAAVETEARRYRIDPLLIWALIEQESGGHQFAQSSKGARGPMQLMPATARRWGVRNPHDPREAVRGGAAYLVWLIDRFGGDVRLGLAGYNAGEGAVDRFRGQVPPYRETQEYVRRIAARYARLRRKQQQQRQQPPPEASPGISPEASSEVPPLPLRRGIIVLTQPPAF